MTDDSQELVSNPRASTHIVEEPVVAAGQRPGARVDRIGDKGAFILLCLGGLCLLATIVVVILEIIYRFVLRQPFVSSGDLLTLSFTWMIFLGIPRAIWHGKAVRLGLTERAPEGIRAVLLGIGEGGSMAFALVMVWSYLSLLPSQGRTTLPTLGIPAYAAGLAVGVGMGLTLLALVWRRIQSGVPARLGLGLVGGILLVAGLYVAPLPPVLVGVVGVLGLILLDAPIAIALGVGGGAMAIGGHLDTAASIPTSQLLVPTENLALLAIPLFMFMGGVFSRSRLAADLSRLVRQLLGWMPGGVGVACVGTAAIFANISGSAIADTAAIGSVYVPQLLRSGYSREDAAALQASAGVVGVVFPPAIAMILFATVANVNVIPVFKAVIVPGLILVVVMAAIAVFHAWRTGIPRAQAASLTGIARAIPASIPVLLIPIILDGGIFSGVFTPAESGAIAVLVSVVLITALRGFSLLQLGQSVEQALDNTALVMFILVCVSILDYGFTTSGISAAITGTLSGVTSPLLMLLLINLIFMIVHEFVDAGPAILVLVPLVLPAAQAAGVNPLQLAVVIAINSTIGAVLPPVGVNLYVSSELAGADPRRVIPRVLPYLAGSVAVLAVVTLVPRISLLFGGV